MLHSRPVPPEMNTESRRLILPPDKIVGTTLDFATSDTVLHPEPLEILEDPIEYPASNKIYEALGEHISWLNVNVVLLLWGNVEITARFVPPIPTDY